MMESVSWGKNRNILWICFGLLACLLMMRFMVIISKFLSFDYPPFRIMMGLDVVFLYLIPVLLVFILTDTLEPGMSFLVPFILVGIVFPLCDVIFLDPTLLLVPEHFVPFLVGGAGLGLIGLAGNYHRREFKKSLVIFTLGIAITLLNSARLLPIPYYVLTGDASSLTLISGL